MNVKQIVGTVGLIGLVSSNLSLAEVVDKEAWLKQLEAQRLLQGVTLSGLIQIEGQYRQDYNDIDSSDIVVDEVDLGIAAQLNQWIKAEAVLIYEEGATPLEFDEAKVTLGNPEASPLYLTAGQMYVPFGNFESLMVSDSLPLMLAETREKAAQLGFETGSLSGSVYIFNGSTQNDGNDTIDHYGGNLVFSQEGETFSYEVGINYISDMGDSDTLGDALEEVNDYDYVEGIGGYLNLNFGPVSLFGEYITALDEFSAEHINFKGDGAQPTAWNLEAGYTMNFGYETTFGLAYQGTEEALGLELPKTRLLGLISVGLDDNTSLSFEYAISEDYDENDGGSGEDAQSAIVQLAVEF
jgi:hypothetical protein